MTPVAASHAENQSSANTTITTTANNTPTTTTVNANQDNLSIQQSNEHANNILTPEQEEEIKLRQKYPNPSKPGGSAFIQKILNKGHKKYFDSGDYNMAKSKNKASNINKNTPQVTTASLATQNETTVTMATPTPSISIHEFQQSPTSANSTITTITDSITPVANVQMAISNATSPHITNSNAASITLTPSISTSAHQHNHHHHHQTSPLSSNINIVNNHGGSAVSPMLSNSLSSSALSSTLQNQQQLPPQTQSHPQMSTSVSTQSIHMLSASLSTEKLAQIQLNVNNSANSLLDSEEIGHGIPTPECLPQSRKHSIVQSKLATPRLSSS